MHLKEIAKIQSGLILARKESKEKTNFYYKSLSLKSINPNAKIDTEYLTDFFAKEKLNPNYLTQINDIVVRNTAPYTAVLIDENSKNLVIPSYFVVLRIKNNKILPAYLHWFLNRKETLNEIQKNSTGNVLNSINAQFFNELQINLPTLQTQELIGKIYTMAMREQEILEILKTQKMLYTKALLEHFEKQLRGEI